VIAYDVLTFLMWGVATAHPDSDIWFRMAAVISFVAAAWVALESFAVLLVPQIGKRPTSLQAGPLLAARLALASLSALVPVGYALADRNMASSDRLLLTTIYGVFASLPLGTALWALRSGRL
jgi:hypothetical protein